jgi:hypothetical protein
MIHNLELVEHQHGKKACNALLSDYDGTLCPTASVRGDGSVGGTILQELEQL